MYYCCFIYYLVENLSGHKITVNKLWGKFEYLKIHLLAKKSCSHKNLIVWAFLRQYFDKTIWMFLNGRIFSYLNWIHRENIIFQKKVFVFCGSFRCYISSDAIFLSRREIRVKYLQKCNINQTIEKHGRMQLLQLVEFRVVQEVGMYIKS